MLPRVNRFILGSMPVSSLTYKRIVLSCLLLFASMSFGVTPKLDSSFVSYRASTPSHGWEAKAPIKRLDLHFDDALGASFEVVVGANAFKSGNFARDVNANKTVFETATYPDIVFRAENLRVDLSKDSQTLSVPGELELHGVMKRLRVPVSLKRGGGLLRASGSFEVLLSDFDMKRPGLFGDVVEDEVNINFEVVLSTGGS